MLHTRDWYARHGITLHAGDPVVRIDRKRRARACAHPACEVRYDRLLIATGSKPFIIPVPGHDLPGVIGFRDLHDVDTMLAAGAHAAGTPSSSAAACSAWKRPTACCARAWT